MFRAKIMSCISTLDPFPANAQFAKEARPWVDLAITRFHMHAEASLQRRLGTVFAALVASSALNGEALDPILAKRLDGEVLRVLDEHHTPSASIAIVQGGRVTYAAAYGQAQISPAMVL